MAKEIDKIIQSKTAPKSNNVLWDDGENLKIIRNGKWESTNKGSSSEELLAYPVEYYEGPERSEHKVVELGGEKLYNYLGEISIPSDNEEVEGTFPGDIIPTEYPYQPIYEGVLQPYFEYGEDLYFNLCIGNDKYGYTSLKIEYSEDPNNLKWFWANGLGMFQEGPGSVCFALSDWTLHYKASSFVPCNVKVYWLYKTQKLDANLIPQEIARKEDILTAVTTEINKYEYPILTIDADNLTYEGDIESKTVRLNINISSLHFENIANNFLYKIDESNQYVYYNNNYIIIIIDKNKKKVEQIRLLKPCFTTYDLDNFDYKNCRAVSGQCYVIYKDTGYPATIDFDDYVTTLINGKYIKYKLNRETHLLELQSELDLSSIESRLAALEAK